MLQHSVELEPLDSELAWGQHQVDLRVIVNSQEELDEAVAPHQYTAYLEHIARTCSLQINKSSEAVNPHIRQCLC